MMRDDEDGFGPSWCPSGTPPGATSAGPSSSRARPDATGPFGGRLTPLPVGAGEAHVLRGIAAAMRDAPARAALEARYAFLRNAAGLGLGTDPDVIAGMDHVLAALSSSREAGRRREDRAAGMAGRAPTSAGHRSGAVRRGASPDRGEAPDEPAPPTLEGSLRRYGEVRRRSDPTSSRVRTTPAAPGPRPTDRDRFGGLPGRPSGPDAVARTDDGPVG